MPNTKSAKKELRKSKLRTIRNRRTKNTVKSLIKKLEKALTREDKKGSGELYRQIQKALDKAAKKKIIKKNTAARKKSRLMKKINSSQTKK